MRTLILIAAAALLAWQAPASAANTVDTLLGEYKAAGAGPFDAKAGATFWTQKHNPAAGGKARSCAACHGTDLSQTGRHVRTGKSIKPMAPSVNPARLTDARKVEKWFGRNCHWTLGRECSAQEKGDVLMFLRQQ